jgi:uncharacterized protein YbjT (DUF2867 family)
LRIAVLGGTGFIGGHLLKALSGTANEIVIISRRGNAGGGSTPNVSYRNADIHNMESLVSALKDIDLVYHLVGIIAETKELTFEKTVIGGTANLVAACGKSGVKRIIYLSALGTSVTSPSKYFQSKWEAEEIICQSGLNYIIVRPSVVFGPDDKFINMLAGMIRRSPIIPIVGNGRYLLQPVYVGDLIDILIDSIGNARAQNKVIEIGGPEQLQFRQLIDLIKKTLSKKRMNFYIPFWFIKPIAAIMGKIMESPPVTVDQLRMLEIGNTCDNKVLLGIYDMKLTKLEDKINDYLR